MRSQFANKKADEKKQEAEKKKADKELQKQNKPEKLVKDVDPTVVKKAKEWTDEDANLVKQMLNEHKSFEEIALVVQRTPLAISFRQQMYVYELVSQGKTTNEVCTQLNLTLDKVKELCEKEEIRLGNGKKDKEKWEANKVLKNEKKQVIEQEKEQEKVEKKIQKKAVAKVFIPDVDNDIKEITELTQVKKLMIENGMKEESEKLEMKIKEKLKERLEKIKINECLNKGMETKIKTDKCLNTGNKTKVIVKKPTQVDNDTIVKTKESIKKPITNYDFIDNQEGW